MQRHATYPTTTLAMAVMAADCASAGAAFRISMKQKAVQQKHSAQVTALAGRATMSGRLAGDGGGTGGRCGGWLATDGRGCVDMVRDSRTGDALIVTSGF